MHEGAVEATRYPRNPLDVARAADRRDGRHGHVGASTTLFDAIRCAAPFADLSRRVFEGVLDMLSGRYPSDEFAELRPRVTWDRVARDRRRAAKARSASRSPTPARFPIAASTASSSLGAPPGAARVGELDEEMVFETQVGETFVLGASSWRIEEITHDRVLVSPAPGEPGKMPFWKGDRAGRPLELGLRHRRADARPAAHAARRPRSIG